jgi:hypothetical protein
MFFTPTQPLGSGLDGALNTRRVGALEPVLAHTPALARVLARN